LFTFARSVYNPLNERKCLFSEISGVAGGMNGDLRNAMAVIRVLIVDDHPLFRDGLNSALSLEDDIFIVGQCADGEEALRRISSDSPDVVIIDINLPSLNGLQVTRMLKASRMQIAVVVLTAYHDSEQVLHAMRAGASAYCAKDIMPDDLMNVIRAVANGFYIVDNSRLDWQGLQAWINREVEASSRYVLDPDDPFMPLSPREMEILECVTRGLSNKEIARRLQISQQTVKNHMTSILKKLNVEDRTQAAVTALRRGWVRLQDDWDSETNRV
jgi:DNA-binding NarL/FixJ family response regulator